MDFDVRDKGEDCSLCEEIASENPLSRRINGTRARAIEKSANFLVLPDIQPVVEGHSLLISKRHIPALSALPASQWDEFQVICERAKSALAIRYRKPFLFEHGPGSGAYSGCCINHAHLHLLPLEVPLHLWLDELVDGRVRRGCGRVVDTLSAVHTSYLYYQSQGGDDFIVDDLRRPVPCQFLRRVVAQHLGLRDWNWKTVLGHVASS